MILAIRYPQKKYCGARPACGFFQRWPIIPPTTYFLPCRRVAITPAGASIRKWLLPRMPGFVYTNHGLAPFARDCDYDNPLYNIMEERCFQRQCKIDTIFILDTFPIVRHKDEQAHQAYHIRRLILQLRNEMQNSLTHLIET